MAEVQGQFGGAVLQSSNASVLSPLALYDIVIDGGGQAEADAPLRQIAADTLGLFHLRGGQLAGLKALVAGRCVLAVMTNG